MKTLKTLHVTDRNAWRSWLESNHDKETEVWLIYFKAHTGKPRIPYDDAVEEALCFGWIDSIVRRIDDEKYAQKFTPRINKDKWSALNKQRVAKLIREGRMTSFGLAKINYPEPGNQDRQIPEDTVKEAEPVFSPEIEGSLKKNEKAWAFFNKLAPSLRKNYIRWVMSAKKEDTRGRRMQELISVLEQDKKLGLK